MGIDGCTTLQTLMLIVMSIALSLHGQVGNCDVSRMIRPGSDRARAR